MKGQARRGVNRTAQAAASGCRDEERFDGASPDLPAALAAFAIGIPSEALPERARRVARLSLVDWASVALAALGEPVARIVREDALEEGGRAEATLVGATVRVPARAAALANGALSHALDYDDTHFAYIGHPSAAVVPAALAVAEAAGADDRAMGDAMLVGVEGACRVGAWLGRAHYQAGFHATATAGAFGATLAATRLLGLDLTRARHALGIVASRAAGLKVQFGTMAKPLQAGLAAANGVEAARLAARGLEAAPDALGGAQGFAATHHGTADASALADLGERFVFEDVSHKLHACCHGTHAALEALGTLLGEGRPAPDALERVTIAVHPRWSSVCDIAAPRTGLEAKFSYRMVAAFALAGLDTAALATFDDARCADPALDALRERVRVETDDALPETAARVALVERGGAARVARHDLAAPVDVAEREARVRAKSAALLGAARAERLWTCVAEGRAALVDHLRAEGVP